MWDVWQRTCSHQQGKQAYSNRPKNQKITQQVIPDTILPYWHQENVILSKNGTRLEPTSSRHCWIGHTWGLQGKDRVPIVQTVTTVYSFNCKFNLVIITYYHLFGNLFKLRLHYSLSMPHKNQNCIIFNMMKEALIWQKQKAETETFRTFIILYVFTNR